MFFNYLKIIIRNFISDRMYSFIIVFGLAVGLATSLMIAQYIHYEFSFDKHHEGSEDVYYTFMRWDMDNEIFDTPSHPAVAPLVKRSVPKVIQAGRVVGVRFDKGDEIVLRWRHDTPSLDFEVYAAY